MPMLGDARKSAGLRRRIAGAPAMALVAAFVLGGALALPAYAQQAELPPADHLADRGTAEEQQACMPDVFRLCRSEIPSEPRIVACLTRLKQDLSPACRKVFTDREAAQRAAAPPRATAARKSGQTSSRRTATKASGPSRTASRSAGTR